MSLNIVVAFANQKGGTGKSTIGTHIASILCYTYGYKVAMADFDYPQNSLVAYRKRDLTLVAGNKKLKERLTSQGLPPYPVIESSVEASNADLVSLMEEGYDFILVDTPGTLNVKGLPDLIKSLDYIFLPMEADSGSVVSTVSYMKLLHQYLSTVASESNLVSYHAFWNKYMKAERKLPYQQVGQLFKKEGLNLLNSRVESLLTYRDNRSTLFSLPERELEKLGLGSLVMELLSIMVGEGETTPSGAKIGFATTVHEDPAPVAVNSTETPTDNQK